jgi:hypothetical protein
MYPYREFHRSRLTQPPWRRRVSVVLPWVFVLGMAAGTLLPVRRWVHRPLPASNWWPSSTRDTDVIFKRGGDPGVHHAIDVVRTIDGDTFEARVHLASGPDITTRVRLRGIDAPELKARCEKELRMAEAASDALRNLLADGGVTISNVGLDK